MSKKIKLLFVDDEERFLKTLSDRLSLRDFDVTPVSSAEEALGVLETEKFDIALLDLKMPGMDGGRLLTVIKERRPDMEVIILTGHGSIDSAVECTKHGAYRYLQKPCETTELLTALSEAYQLRIQKKLLLTEQKMNEILGGVQGRSPLDILRRLKDLSGEDKP